MSCVHYYDSLLVPWLLDACSAEEDEHLSKHASDCDSCQERISHLAPALTTLLLASPEIPAPDSLRYRVASTIKDEASLFAAAAEPEPSNKRQRLARKLRRMWRDLALSPTGLFLVLAPIGAFFVLVTIGLTVQGENGGRERVVGARVDLQHAPNGYAQIEVDRSGAHLRVEGLPRSGRGEMYQVWTRRKARQPLQLTGVSFDVDSQGNAYVRVPGQVQEYEQLIVTIEKAKVGGAGRPSGKPVVRVDI